MTDSCACVVAKNAVTQLKKEKEGRKNSEDYNIAASISILAIDECVGMKAATSGAIHGGFFSPFLSEVICV